MDDDISGNPFLLADIPHPKKVEGYPLDRISLHIGTGKYYYELPRKITVRRKVLLTAGRISSKKH